MKNLNRFRPMPSHLITHEGPAFLITDLDGFIGRGIEGFYYQQTRFLSKMRLAIGGRAPLGVSANSVDSYSSIAYYLAASPAGRQAGPLPDKGEKGGGEMVRHGIEVQINRFVGGGVHHDLYVTNHALGPAEVVLCWELEADFADLSEAEQGERQQNAAVERQWKSGGGSGVLALHYRHPQLRHATEIRFSGSGDLSDKDGAVWSALQLLPQQPVSLCLDVVPIFCGERVRVRYRRDMFDVLPICVSADAGLQMTAGNAQVQRAWDRAVSDLASLALLEGEDDQRQTPAAGIPKYVALFGRDMFLTAFQASFLTPAMMRESISLIAQWNATKYDERFDEEPGRVIHQRQLSPLALLE